LNIRLVDKRQEEDRIVLVSFNRLQEFFSRFSEKEIDSSKMI
jgi:hypothetical protein